MKKIKQTLFLAPLLFGVGCARTGLPEKAENLIDKIFVANIDSNQDETKTTLDGTPASSERYVLWTEDDYIAVMSANNSAKFTCISGAGTTQATFSGNIDEATDYVAVYPYGLANSRKGNIVYLSLPSEQEYAKENVADTSFPMVANCKDGVFDFKNICGILVLQLTGTDIITDITFQGYDESGHAIPVSGSGHVDMSYSDSPTLLMEESANNSVKLICPKDGIQLSESEIMTFHIILPAGTYDSFAIQFTTNDGDKTIRQGNKPLTIKRSKRTTAAAFTYIGVIDLSKYETANCYLVSEPGVYKYNASVKGNSSEKLSNPKDAYVLWESYGNDVCPEQGALVSNIEFKDGYVYFTVPLGFTSGNAAIAVTDESGKILWSWHIWVAAEGYRPQLYPLSDITMMDRNLGASSIVPGEIGTHGLLYQWGRKDPFLGSRDVYYGGKEVSGLPKAVSTVSWPNSVTSNASTGTVEYVVANPMTFVNDPDYEHGHWVYEKNTESYQLWQSKKTMFDPCPAGWRVPDGGWEGVWYKSLNPDLHIYQPTSYPYIIGTWDSHNGGMDLQSVFNTTEACWYPGAGRIDRNSYGYSYAYGEYWAVRDGGDAHFSIQLRNYIYPAGESIDKAPARSVRCQLDENYVAEPLVFVDNGMKEYALAHFDLNKDGKISEFEANKVTSMDLSGTQFSTYDDMKLFPNLAIANLSSSMIYQLDLSKLHAIKAIDLYDCTNLFNVIVDRDICNPSILTNKYIVIVDSDKGHIDLEECTDGHLITLGASNIIVQRLSYVEGNYHDADPFSDYLRPTIEQATELISNASFYVNLLKSHVEEEMVTVMLQTSSRGNNYSSTCEHTIRVGQSNWRTTYYPLFPTYVYSLDGKTGNKTNCAYGKDCATNEHRHLSGVKVL